MLKEGLKMKKKCVITMMLLMVCNAYATNAELNLRNKEKVNNEYMLSLKNKLSTCKAFKAPFAKLSGVKPMLLFSLIGFATLYYCVCECNYYAFLSDDFFREKMLTDDRADILSWSFLVKNAKHNADVFRLYANASFVFTSIPWVALMVNKWLDWSCESLQEDIDAVMQDIVV